MRQPTAANNRPMTARHLLLRLEHDVQDVQAPAPHVTSIGLFRLSRPEHTFGIRERDRNYFTANCRGEVWRVACLPMGWLC
jgi:hypothetical protein